MQFIKALVQVDKLDSTYYILFTETSFLLIMLVNVYYFQTSVGQSVCIGCMSVGMSVCLFVCSGLLRMRNCQY